MISIRKFYLSKPIKQMIINYIFFINIIQNYYKDKASKDMYQENSATKSKDNTTFVHKPSPTEITIKLTQLFSQKDIETTCQCLLILDNEINIHLLGILEPKCQNIVLVDGGSNRFYSTKFRESSKVRCIIGDLDGIKDETRHFYQKKGVDIIHDPDQNTTDFQKALKHCTKMGYSDLLYFNCYPGRIDHVLAAMSTTQKYLTQHKDNSILLLGKNSLMLYLHPKLDYTVNVKSQWIQEKGCGMITFGKVSQIETRGFKWNLGEEEYYKTLEWGNFLSTSNQFVEHKVQVSSSDPLFLVAQVKQEQPVEGNW